MKLFVINVAVLICFLFFTTSELVAAFGTAVPGQPLWGITKRIGAIDDIIESKVDALDTTIASNAAALNSQANGIESTLSALNICKPTILSSSDVSGGIIVLSTAGSYCVSEDLTASVTISGSSIFLDLNDRVMTGILTIDGIDDARVLNGTIAPPAPTSAPVAGITIDEFSERAVIKNVTVQCADSATSGVAGRDGISIDGDNAQIIGCTIRSGSGASSADGGDAILTGTNANDMVIMDCLIESGDGGDSTTASGGDSGYGIHVNESTDMEIVRCIIFKTGNGGSSTFTSADGGDGGDGIFIAPGSTDIAVRSCIVRNTGSGGTGGVGGSSGENGKAIDDEVTTGVSESLVFGNFAHNIANAVNFDLQGSGVEKGVNSPNPPTSPVVNSFANVYM